jgi:uncharacterized protein YbjT (DUF2867 family)
VILVIGGTGTVGTHLLRSLRARGVPTRALIRRPFEPGEAGPLDSGSPVDSSERGDTVEYVVGDAADRAALEEALTGVDQVFLTSANGPRQLDLELGVVRAASHAGISHLVKVSAPRVGPDVPVAIARMHYLIEQAIARTAMEATALRPYAFMQNLIQAHAHTIRQTGMFFGTIGDAQINMVDARDIADVATAALTDRALPREPLVLTGDSATSYPEIAGLLSGSGKRISYVNQSPATMRKGMERAGLPTWLVDHIIEIQNLTLTHPEIPTDTVRRILGRPARTVDDFLVENAGRFTPPRWTKAAPLHWLATKALSA